MVLTWCVRDIGQVLPCLFGVPLASAPVDAISPVHRAQATSYDRCCDRWTTVCPPNVFVFEGPFFVDHSEDLATWGVVRGCFL